MKSLFFVSSPLEMICAIEARYQFKTKNNVLVLYLFDIDKTIISYILSMSEEWEHVYSLSRSSINYGKKWVRLTNKLKKEKYNYLFSSGMTFSAHFLFNLKYKKQFFLDDGTLTLSNVAYFKDNGNLTKKMSLFPGHNKTKFKHKLNEGLHYLFGHKLRGKWQKLALFTFFDIDDSTNITIVKNKLTWFSEIKKNKQLKTDENVVYLIGTPLIFAKIISESYYFELLDKIKIKFNDKKIIYIPHRWEPKKDIDKIKDTFEFIIKPNKNIIEIDFLTEGISPKYIVGTISTALFTLNQLYSESNIYTTSLDINKVFIEKKEAVNAILNFQKGRFIKL